MVSTTHPSVDSAGHGSSLSAARGRPGPQTDEERRLWEILERVMDPEIPVLSVVDLGVVRYLHLQAQADGAHQLHIGLTPTYSGCPATEVIRDSVRQALRAAGYPQVALEEVLFPPWSSDWLSERGRQKLRAFGIAPPDLNVHRPRQPLHAGRAVCPRCSSSQTERISEFGSTPCKAHYRCLSCLEPFDQFKCI